jgi:hypothetical protein
MSSGDSESPENSRLDNRSIVGFIPWLSACKTAMIAFERKVDPSSPHGRKMPSGGSAFLYSTIMIPEY